MLNVQRLRVLREVAEKGAKLIERDRKGVRPTAAGAALVAHADAILSRIEAAEAELKSILGLHGGLLRMASFPTAGNTLMPLAIAKFRTAHPQVELTLAEGEPEEIAPRLRAGEFDLALLFEFHHVGDSLGRGLREVDLLEDPMHMALPYGHALAEKKELRLEDLQEEAWGQTSASSACARHVVRLCHSVGFDPIVSFESDDYATVQGLVAAGVGVALIPELALTSVREDIVVRTLAPPTPMRRVVAATPRSDGVSPAAAEMLELLKQ